MILPMPDEMRDALKAHPGSPLQIADEQSQQTFVLVNLDDYRRLIENRLCNDLQVGFDQADRGEVAPWNVDEFLQKAHRSQQ